MWTEHKPIRISYLDSLASQQLKGWAGTISPRSLCIHQVTIYCQSRNIFFTENIPGMLIAVITMRKTTRTPVVRGYIISALQ